MTSQRVHCRAEPRPSHILVPFDGSAPAWRALEQALTCAHASQAGLTLLAVLYLPSRAALYVSPCIHRLIADNTRRGLDCALQRVHESGIEGHGLIVRGIPWQQIVEVARTSQADLIVIGTHGRTGLARLLSRGTATKVQRHAPCRVQVVGAADTLPLLYA
jgi:nucleotide-binding universal stress UspA family protein